MLHEVNFLNNDCGETIYSTHNKLDHFGEDQLKQYYFTIINDLEACVTRDCKRFNKPHMTGESSVEYLNNHIRAKLRTLEHGLNWSSYVEEVQPKYKNLRLEYTDKEYNSVRGEADRDILYINYDDFEKIVHQRHPLQKVLKWVTIAVCIFIIVTHLITRGAVV